MDALKSVCVCVYIIAIIISRGFFVWKIIKYYCQ